MLPDSSTRSRCAVMSALKGKSGDSEVICRARRLLANVISPDPNLRIDQVGVPTEVRGR